MSTNDKAVVIILLIIVLLILILIGLVKFQKVNENRDLNTNTTSQSISVDPSQEKLLENSMNELNSLRGEFKTIYVSGNYNIKSELMNLNIKVDTLVNNLKDYKITDENLDVTYNYLLKSDEAFQHATRSAYDSTVATDGEKMKQEIDDVDYWMNQCSNYEADAKTDFDEFNK